MTDPRTRVADPGGTLEVTFRGRLADDNALLADDTGTLLRNLQEVVRRIAFVLTTHWPTSSRISLIPEPIVQRTRMLLLAEPRPGSFTLVTGVPHLLPQETQAPFEEQLP